MTEHKSQWHPVFQATVQIEMGEDKTYMMYLSEYNLTKKPQQIDILIRKSTSG